MRPAAVTKRVSRFYYGIATFRTFQPGTDPENKLVGNKNKCLFHVAIDIKSDQKIKQTIISFVRLLVETVVRNTEMHFISLFQKERLFNCREKLPTNS